MLPIIYMLWSIECFDFSVLLFKEFCFIVTECFMLLVSQKNNVCVGGWVGGWVRACVHACVLAACVRACVRACLCACVRVCVKNYILPGFNILLHKCCL